MSSEKAIGQRLELALELSELGAEMYAAKLRRENPELSAADVEKRLVAWFQSRPGAENGDSWGKRVSWPLTRA